MWSIYKHKYNWIHENKFNKINIIINYVFFRKTVLLDSNDIYNIYNEAGIIAVYKAYTSRY